MAIIIETETQSNEITDVVESSTTSRKEKSLSIAVGNHTLSFETGKIANITESSIVARMGDTVLLVTVATQKPSHPIHGMLPLTVTYIAPFYAAGRLPGGFNKRETKPSDPEVIEARLIDRSIRPLFPNGFSDEIQIVVKCLSYDPEHEPSSFAITAVSAALRLSSLPFEKAIASVRVGEINGQWVLNPSAEDMKKSTLDLVIAGAEDSVLMVECGANEHTEEQIIDALFWGHSHIQQIIAQIEPWTTTEGKTVIFNPHPSHVKHEHILMWLNNYTPHIHEALSHTGKVARNKVLDTLKSRIEEDASPHLESWSTQDMKDVMDNLKKIQRLIVRKRIIEDNMRIDGRNSTTVRPISIETGLLPRTHGSALFTRGETQALAIVTLGSDKDAQVVDGIHGDIKERFLLHYNFPPYSVGECGMMGAPKRREIGHGRLARRALSAVLPNDDAFPYVIRVVSEITACNGSSSMATVCGGSLALMDAGVPLKRPVAGVAMGLVKEEGAYTVLTDILGDEDAYGDMDFKVAGTEQGITALQMDIKVDGLSRDIMENALKQAHTGRLHILKQMDAALSTHRTNVSDNAPKVIIFTIKPDKIREVIGKGGSVIKDLCERYTVAIDINEQGQIKISAVNGQKGEEAQKHILSIVKEIEIGDTYEGQVTKIMDFGAFITLIPGKDGFLHISEISDQHVSDINEHLKRGQTVIVKVLEIDAQQRIRVSMRNTAKK